ncbi:monocarboxylate transporter 9 isoform X2 [Drosophila kikkawai]|uniref:Monocarboxylate transporter 9 isoform X2 n=1 Tax=Drosophila kikkawai TaxID=30033 RepID=A0A6P4I642_DROKI|nr:monocarboxylate transporter 9 [Drosophila kikkawai]
MSRNRRRSHSDIATSSEEEQTAAPDEPNANREAIPTLSSRENDNGTAADRQQPSWELDVAKAGCSSSSSTHSTQGEPTRVLFYNIRSPSARRHFPHILVEASKETKDRESDVNAPQEKADPPYRTDITEPISELPYLEPKFTQPSRDADEKEPSFSSEPSWTGSLWSRMSRLISSAKSRSESSLEMAPSQGGVSLSEMDEYDREEPLITKTQKYYKKRPTLIPIFDDSEESSLVSFERQNNDLPFKRNTLLSADIDSPEVLSDYTAEPRIANLADTPLSSEETPSAVVSDRNLPEGTVFIYMVIPPDGGYGWLIMVIGFLCQLIVDGILLSIGGILPEIEQEFNAIKSQMVLVGSVQIGCYYLSGSFASILINRFAFRPVAISGALLSMLAVVAGSFSPNLYVLILVYSAIGGCSLSLIWCSSQLIVACYFERYRPVANGFACSGVGAGACVFSLLNNWLVPIIGWRNMLRVQAGALLLVVLMTIAYVEVRPVKVGMLPENILDSSSDEYYGNFYVHYYLRGSQKTPSSKSLLSLYDPDQDQSKCCPCCRKCLKRRRERKEQVRREKKRNMIIRTSYIEREDLFYTGPAEYEKPHSRETLEGKEIQLLGSEKSTQQANYGIQHINKGEDRRATAESIERGVPKKRCVESKFMRMLSRLFDYHLFKQFEFRILVVSAFLYPMGFNIPFVYSKARTKIHKDYANLITPAIGFTNFTCRIICGFVAYKRRTWTTNICGGGLVFGGFFVFLSAFFGQDLVWFQMLYGICYGVAPAVYATLRAIIYVKYLGLAKLTNAFGITALAMGIGVFSGTTIAGWLVGDSLNYTAAFVFAGLCLMSSGMLKLMLPSLVKCHYRQLNRKRKSSRKTVRPRKLELVQ